MFKLKEIKPRMIRIIFLFFFIIGYLGLRSDLTLGYSFLVLSTVFLVIYETYRKLVINKDKSFKDVLMVCLNIILLTGFLLSAYSLIFTPSIKLVVAPYLLAMAIIYFLVYDAIDDFKWKINNEKGDGKKLRKQFTSAFFWVGLILLSFKSYVFDEISFIELRNYKVDDFSLNKELTTNLEKEFNNINKLENRRNFDRYSYEKIVDFREKVKVRLNDKHDELRGGVYLSVTDSGLSYLEIDNKTIYDVPISENLQKQIYNYEKARTK
ncbi:hypothetical protein SAMN02745163_03155 [Clostridium cavendishii DSM 21758]|uniref:Uncharacterized protein n=1 Tax=Clostridium cavendishii DSM 21758 TaxID=1121302 RepID=A0A1M6PH61_9CLOT|nr:hypothetical protein [Clostridium cavendishii]SHK07288.1 hypothetical protein SAMN02745163_03155 [Clostridium cavendishii DSM 21758]